MFGIKCPKCGKELQMECLTSYPPYYQVKCLCGFSLPYYKRKDSHKAVTQEELDEYLTTAST